MDVNKKIKFGTRGKVTPIVVAVVAGKAKICKLLINEGADVKFKWMQNKTLLYWCAGAEHVNNDMNHDKVAQLLIDNGLDVNAELTGKAKGMTPLYIAARSGNFEVAKVLIKNGANVNARHKRLGNTPLDVAVSKEHKKIADLIRKNGGTSGKN